jgi:hypothetical protein
LEQESKLAVAVSLVGVEIFLYVFEIIPFSSNLNESMGRDHPPFNFDAICTHHLLILLFTFFVKKCNER